MIKKTSLLRFNSETIRKKSQPRNINKGFCSMNHRKLIFRPCNYKEINDHETEGS